MQTLPANNPDGKGPVRDNINKPTDQDPGPKDGAIVEAAEGEIESTPQGP